MEMVGFKYVDGQNSKTEKRPGAFGWWMWDCYVHSKDATYGTINAINMEEERQLLMLVVTYKINIFIYVTHIFI